MTIPPPPIDPRTETEIAKQVQDLLAVYAPDWQEFAPTTHKPQGVSAALIHVFARFAGIIIQRLNQVPDKNFLAFLDLLGASLLPPQPARAPLTFSLTAGSVIDGIVPAGTQVAAPPAAGEKEPVIFETDRELVVTAAELVSILSRHPELDQYADYSPITKPDSFLEVPVFQGNRPIEHILYLGDRLLLSFPQMSNLSLTFTLTSQAPLEDERVLKWEFWNGTAWQEKTSTRDSTQQLRQSGTIDFENIQVVPLGQVNSLESRWLRSRLTTPIRSAAQPQVGMVRPSQLPQIATVTLQAQLNRSGLAIEAAFTNLLPLDLSKPFLPLGEKPKFADTLYLANPEAFSKSEAKITLQVALVNPVDVGMPATNPSSNPELKLQWEFWDGQSWVAIGRSTPSGSQAGVSPDFQDDTLAFTRRPDAKPIQVTFTLPGDRQPKATTINGRESFWLRVQIIAGNYGKEAQYRLKTPERPEDGYILDPATFAPPLLQSVTVDYELTTAAAPEQVFTYNDFVYTPISSSSSFQPFQPTQDIQPTLYFGLTLPQERQNFPNRPISLFCQTSGWQYGENLVPISPTHSQKYGASGARVTHKFRLTNTTSAPVQFWLSTLGTRWDTTLIPPLPQEAGGDPQPITLAVGESLQAVQVTIPAANTAVGDRDRGFLQLRTTEQPPLIYNATLETVVGPEIPPAERLQLSWQYWRGTEWAKLLVHDNSENLTRPGLIEFLPPSDFSIKEDFQLPPRYWLRVVWEKGDYQVEPRLSRVLLNTTMAAQTATIRSEILGSSDGTENQRFYTTRSPVLPGQQLQVQESEMPSADEQAILISQEGEDAIASLVDATGRPHEIWVRWHEVPDFYGSGPRDRHYILDHLTGEIQFGDGLNGLIPPLAGNLRLASYQTGGGIAGNKPANTIVQLKTTVPYVDKVTNTVAATGGAEAETLDSLRDRTPRTIRHGGRAVSLEDYADLAMLASPEVARVKCVPLRNLIDDPLDTKPPLPGEVSVIIVPRSNKAKPLPSWELIRHVQSFLVAHQMPTANLSVVGPLYISVNVTTEIALTALAGASAVEQAVEQKLASFLHPLTGGLDAAGWDFGREPYKSDFYALIEAIPGVDHINLLDVDDTEDQPGAKQTGRFLVYSGRHTIRLTFEES